MKIETILGNIYSLPSASVDKFLELAELRPVFKGNLLLDADLFEDKVYFIKKGLARAFARLDNQDAIFWFGKEGDVIMGMNYVVLKQKGYEYIDMLEDGELYFIRISELQKFYQQDIHWANWGRCFAEIELRKSEERFISRQFKTARERYLDLIEQQPDLTKRLQLNHIASYLGITQVSLSRIRAELV